MVQLGKLESIGQVADLFQSLGYTRQIAQLDDDEWMVARWRGFRVTVRLSQEPERTAARMARDLVSRSQRSAAVALNPGKELSVAAPRIGVPGITNILSIVVAAPTAYDLHRLELLRPLSDSTALAHSLRVAEVLDQEPAGDRFFTAFRMVFNRMMASRGEIPKADRRALVLLNLIRMLFLYFIQAKGWLDGRLDYLRVLFDSSLHDGKNFHTDVFNALCFRSLNVPRARRKTDPLGNIPYLNGGLFEPNAVESRHTGFAISNEIWRDAFDELFERFQFCVSEIRHVDSIAPDMLGRVFERMGEPDRESTGTFYTPEVVVRQMVEATLETALTGQNGLDRERAGECVRDICRSADAPTVMRFLKGVKILDPAVGSGAFLLGALEVVSRIWEQLTPSVDPVGIRRRVIKNNLFGVDQSPTAVKLAELRLWLALISEDATPDVALVEPLPNFNGVIRQGDTLIDPLRFPTSTRAEVGELTEIRRLRQSLFSARGPNRQRNAEKLRVAEQTLARNLLEHEQKRTDRQLEELDRPVKDLFGREGRDSEARKRLEQLKTRAAELKDELEALNDGRVPFFSFKVHAPDVMARGGFDIVLGNPPWVRAEKIRPELRKVLHDRYSWWRSSRERGYAHRPDLSIAFLQRAFQLLAPGGVIGFLLPSKLLTSGYASVARANLVREGTVAYLHRVPEVHARRFGATTYPLALIARRRKPEGSEPVKLDFNGVDHFAHERLRDHTPWLMLGSKSQSAVDRVLASGVALRDFAPPQIGIKTGCNRVYVGRIEKSGRRTATVRLSGSSVEFERELVRPALRGRDVNAFATSPSAVIIWPYDDRGVLRAQLPARAARYFRASEQTLRSRSDYRGGPFWTLFRVRLTAARNLVVWADIARGPAAAVLTDVQHTGLPLNSCYVCRIDSADRAHCVTAVLNSTWARAIASSLADEARGGYRRINARVAGSIPVPVDHSAVAQLASLSRAAHEDHHHDQAALDRAVASALGITKADRRALRRIVNRG